MSGLLVLLTLAFAFGLWSGQRSAESLEILTLESSSTSLHCKVKEAKDEKETESG